MKSSEIRELSNQELLERIDNEKTALVRTRLNHAISPLAIPQKIRESRKTIARLMTEMRKREISKKTK